MPDTSEISEVKLALLEKCLRGDLPQTPMPTNTQRSSVPLSYAEARVPVVPIQTGGSKRPLFYLHVHVIGGAFYNFTLAHELGPDQPFYMLDPYMFNNNKELPPTLETMAAAYIESLRTVQSEGPYLLAGFCGGGIIAFEMAQQLHAQGQKVDLLVLIEPRDGPAYRVLFWRRFGSFIRYLGPLIGLSLEKQLELFLRIRSVSLNLLQLLYKPEKKFRLFPSTEFLRTDWIGVFVWILSQYRPRQYPGKVTCLWACEEPEYLRTWWGKVVEAKELEVHLIPGTHDTCRTEHLHDMAEHLEACLSKAQEPEL